MTVIYIDILFIINAFVNFLLLSLTARLSAVPARPLRLWLGAGLGGVFSIVLFFAPAGLIYGLLFKGVLCGAIVCVTFGKRRLRDYLRLVLIFCLVTFALGGVVFALSVLGLVYGTVSNGVLYFNLSLGKLIFGGLATYFGLTLLLGHDGLTCEIAEITLYMGGQRLGFSAMVDTGNCLTEPVTGKHILLVSQDILGELVPEDMERWTALKPYPVPYKTADGGGVLFAFCPDRLYINGVENGDHLIGLSPTKIRGKQSTGAIIGGMI